MKKLFAILLAVAMVAALAVVASADVIDEMGAQTAPVKGTYVEYTQTPEYNVTLTWGTMDFTYTQATQQWDEVNHKWIADADAEWEATGNSITLKNDSSEELTAAFAYANEGTLTGINAAFACTTDGATFADNTLTLPLGPVDDEATVYTVTLTLSGTPSANFGDDVTIGNITITLVDPA